MSETQIIPHVSRGVPPPGPCRRGLDRRLSFPHRKLPGSFTRAAGENFASKLPPNAPEQGEAFDQILGDIERVILPGITPTGSRPTSTLTFPAKRLWAGHSSAICFPPDWACKACSGPPVRRARELETHVPIGWLPMLGLPKISFFHQQGRRRVIQDTASSASLCACWRARTYNPIRQQSKAAMDASLPIARHKLTPPIEKAMKIAGMGSDNLRQIRSGQKLRHAPRSSGAADRI